MKKINIKKTITLLLAVFVITSLFLPSPVYAENAASYTYTISEDGQWARTQDGYLTGEILFRDAELKKPEDIFIRGKKIYVADTGNGQIAIMNMEDKSISFIGKDILSSPTGVFVDENNRILVADYGLEKVAMFSETGELIRWYERPTSVIFGKRTTFKPRKVVSDKRGNIYIVSQGSYDGIIQLSKEGEFLGYFGANQTQLTPLQALQNIIFTAAQKAKLFNRIPKTFYNIAIDKKGMIYSVTQSVKGDAVKKHSVAGLNLLKPKMKMIDEENFVSVTVGAYGQIYALTETGLIYEYDSAGNLIFSFGGRAIATERNGLFTVAAGVAVDEDDYLYILDKERGSVQVFYPTTFAETIHKSISLFRDGKYVESKELWEEILQLSGTSRIAHNGMGKAFFQTGDFEEAAKHFKIAQSRLDYSDSYWEIRNNWLQENTIWIIAIIAALILIKKLLTAVDRRFGIFNPLRKISNNMNKSKIYRDLIYIKKFLRHPIDSFYYLRRDEKGSVKAATIIYFLALVIFTVNYFFKGFIFNIFYGASVSYSYVLVLFLAPCALWVVSNYMVSNINQGEGRLRDVYCAAAYSFAPFVLFMPIVIALTYVLTYNEAFIIQFSSIVIWTWCGILLFLGLKEIHNYEIKETIKNILLTLFLMFIAVIVFSIIYMLWDQGISFVYSLVKEASYNVWK